MRLFIASLLSIFSTCPFREPLRHSSETTTGLSIGHVQRILVINVTSRKDSLSLTLNFPVNALDVETGTTVDIGINVVDPFIGVELAPQLFPETSSSEHVFLDSIVLGDISIRKSGTKDQVHLRRWVELVFQLNETANVTIGERIPAWSFNEERGIWIEEGDGVVSLSSNGNLTWTYNASDLKWWNCDRPWTDTNCIKANVTHIRNGVVSLFPLPDAIVSVQGLSYNYFASSPTSRTGDVCLEAKRGQPSLVRVEHSPLLYDSGNVLVVGSQFSSACPSQSLVWSPVNSWDAGDVCEEVNILCRRI